MNKKKWIKLGLTVLLAFSLTACGTKDSGNADQSNSAVTMTAEAENAQEALSTYKKLMEQENEILSENTDPVSYTHLPFPGKCLSSGTTSGCSRGQQPLR